MSFEIEKIHAREILDSRGNPTIEVDVYTCCGYGCATVPSVASRISHEALKLCEGRDMHFGKGILKTVKKVNEVTALETLGINVSEPYNIAQFMIEMDGPHNKSTSGSNYIFGISLTTTKAAASHSVMMFYKHLSRLNSCSLLISSFKVSNICLACLQRFVHPGVHDFAFWRTSEKVSIWSKIFTKHWIRTSIGHI